MQIRYNLADIVDISRLYKDADYAKEMGIIVKQQKSLEVKKLEQQLTELDNDDENWREKVMQFKSQITEAKKTENNLYVLKYNKADLNVSNQKTLGLFRSVILHNDKIISFSPPKSIDYQTFINNSEKDDSRCFAKEEFIEGTMINMFYNSLTKDWDVASRSSIGARCAFYQDKRITFRAMFLEAMNHLGYEFTDFDKRYCYSWILQHPDNRIVVPFTQPNLVLCRVYSCNNLCVEEISMDSLDKKYSTPRLLAKVIDCEGLNFNELSNKFNLQHTDYKIMGAVIRNTSTGDRTKIRNPTYEHVRKLKGNSPKLQYQYYNLRQLGSVGEFLKYYPEHKVTFDKMRKQVHNFTFDLHSNYIRCYIKKEKPLLEFPFEYRTHMYCIHQLYLNELRIDGNSVKKHIVIDYINNIPCHHLMRSINYPLKKRKIDEIKSVVKDIQETEMEASM
jgi:hypothetical protein